MCERLQPDIVLTDIEMPLMTGLELAAELKERRLPPKLIVVTTFGRSGYLRRALEAGVRGYLLKDASVDALAAAIRAVHAGGRAIAPELALESWSGGSDRSSITVSVRAWGRLRQAAMCSGWTRIRRSIPIPP